MSLGPGLKPGCTAKEDHQARTLKFRIYEVKGLDYLYSENKGTDLLHGYFAADRWLCFAFAKNRFSHDENFCKQYKPRSVTADPDRH